VSTPEIQTPLALVVHPKMTSGIRVPFRPALRDATSPPVSNAEFGLQIVELAGRMWCSGENFAVN